MMKFAICNEVFKGWSWEDTCRFVAEAGYDGIEIAPFTLAEDVRTLSSTDRDLIRQAADKANLEIIGLHWLLVSPEGLSLTSEEDSVRATTTEYMVSLVDFCGDVGGKVMTLGSPKQRRMASDGSLETTSRRFLDGVRPALDRACDRGILICLEPLPPPEADFLLTLREATLLIDILKLPAARTIFDVKSASSEGIPLPELIEEYKPFIAHVHANDPNLRGPGFGDTDFIPIFRALKAADYRGYVSVEPFDYTPDPHTVATGSLRYMRQCLAVV